MAIDRRRWLPLPALGLIASAAAAQAPPLGPEVERIATGAEGAAFAVAATDESAAMGRFAAYTMALA